MKKTDSILMNRFVSRALTIAIGLCAGYLPTAAEPVRIVGSDLLGDQVETVLRQTAEDLEVSIQVGLTGSRPGWDALSQNYGDIAVLLRGPSSRNLPESWSALPLGYLTAYVVVSERLRIDQLNFSQLTAIFADESSTVASRWTDFGARGESSGWQVRPHITGPSQGISHELFLHTVPSRPRLKNTVRAHDSVTDTLTAILAQDGGIAIVPRIPAEATGVKALLLAPSSEAVAFSPTAENIRAGDYPLRIELTLVFRTTEGPELKKWLRLWYSEAMRAAFEAGGVVPLPAGVRGQQDFALEQLR